MSSERLELDQDLRFQRREWRVQRFGWLLWAAFIAAGLAGLVGPGPFSTKQAATSDGRLVVEFDRYVHRHYPTQFRLSMQPGDEEEDSVRLHISQPLLDRVRISEIMPEPAAQEVAADGVWYEFSCKPGAESVQAVFHIEHDKIGSGTGLLQLADGQPLSAGFFVYP